MGEAAETYFEKRLKTKRPATRTEYRRYLGKFLEWAELSHEGLYEMAKRARTVDDPREGDEVTDMVKAYLEVMEGKGYSNSTQNMFLKSLAFFMAANKLPFVLKDLRKRRISNGVRRATLEDAREMFMYGMGTTKTKNRNRALMCFLLGSGFRVSDASNLNVEDYLRARSVEVDGRVFKVFEPFKTQKTGDLAYPIIGSEAIDALDKYLGTRVDGPLFLSDEGKRWSARAMSVHFIRQRKFALGDKSRVSAHSFRKAHRTLLEGAGMPSEWVKILQGKKSDVYSQPQDGPELLNAYARAYPALTLFGLKESDHKEIQGLRDELKMLKVFLAENVFPMAQQTGVDAETMDSFRRLFKIEKAGASYEKLEAEAHKNGTRKD